MHQSSQHSQPPATRRREVAGSNLGEDYISPGVLTDSHWHERPWLSFVLGGAYTQVQHAGAPASSPANVFFLPPGDYAHACNQQTGVLCFSIEVAPRWLQMASECSIVLDTPVLRCSGPLVGLAARLYHEFRQPDAASSLAIEGLILQFMAEASRYPGGAPENSCPRWLRQAEELLADHFAEDLTSEEIAASVHVHPVHLARVFRQYHDCSPGEYIRQKRLEFATRELCRSEKPLLEIALAAGYYDQSHFSNAFKRHTGMSPARFRERCRRP